MAPSGAIPVNLTRLLNATADCYTALRLAGWSAEDAGRIVTEEATKVINAIPTRPYPQEIDHADRDCQDEWTRPAARGD